ncbi:MAG TPA: outer membrane beta-barrel protein [Bryobacteraceae bacterium]|nr:outer membrane beta-barrel protein [Bryobacteraceae bacterium]
MRTKMLSHAGVAAAVFFGLSYGACAQTETEFHHFTFNAGGGLTMITGRDAGELDHGGNFQAGAGINFNRYFGITGNFMFNQLGITRGALDALNEPDGNGKVYSITADPTIHMPLGHGFNAYLLAGGGWLRRTVQFTQPTIAETTVFDPWWGYFGPALVPVNQVLGSVSDNGGVYDIGGGLNIPLPNTGIKLYLEARYYHGFTNNSNTEIVPVSLGIRW